MIPYVKAHACGNDFLIVEESLAHQPAVEATLEQPAIAARHRHAELARRLCSRSTSVGADGIEFLARQPDASFFLRLFNADGSEAELSGNGTRCVAAWLAYSEGLQEVTLGTHGGPRTCRIVEDRAPHYLIESAMGVPRVMERTLDLPDIGPVAGAMVNVGNPHFVLFPQSADFSAHGLAWQQLGERIATSPLFPHGTNVEFVQVLSPGEIAFRIYERGCGPTTSSGTGTCASATAAIALRGASTSLTAHAEGGPQQVSWPVRDSQMLLTGPAELIARGEAW